MNAPINAQVRVGHVHLKVADLGRALDFYCGVLGFELMQRIGSQAAFVSAGGYHHHIGLNTWESLNGAPPAPGTTGLYHFAILYPARAALADALRRLASANIEREHRTGRRKRPRRQRSPLFARSRRQRAGTLLGQAARRVAAHARRRTRDVHAPPRFKRFAARTRWHVSLKRALVDVHQKLAML